MKTKSQYFLWGGIVTCVTIIGYFIINQMDINESLKGDLMNVSLNLPANTQTVVGIDSYEINTIIFAITSLPFLS